MPGQSTEVRRPISVDRLGVPSSTHLDGRRDYGGVRLLRRDGRPRSALNPGWVGLGAGPALLSVPWGSFLSTRHGRHAGVPNRLRSNAVRVRELGSVAGSCPGAAARRGWTSTRRRRTRTPPQRTPPATRNATSSPTKGTSPHVDDSLVWSTSPEPRFANRRARARAVACPDRRSIPAATPRARRSELSANPDETSMSTVSGDQATLRAQGRTTPTAQWVRGGAPIRTGGVDVAHRGFFPRIQTFDLRFLDFGRSRWR
jgi:hypothetical protein